MQTFQINLCHCLGAGGAGLRAAIAAAQANPMQNRTNLKKYTRCVAIPLLQQKAPPLSRRIDSFEYHFHDTVAGGDWLCGSRMSWIISSTTAQPK